MKRWLAYLSFCSLWSVALAARAEEPLELRIDPPSNILDARHLVRRMEEQLKRPVMLVENERFEGRDRLIVQLKDAELRLIYQEGSISRVLAQEPADSLETQIALVAQTLIAQQLPEGAGEPPSTPSLVEDGTRPTGGDETAAAERLKQSLQYATEVERTGELVVSGAALGVGAALIPVGLHLKAEDDPIAGMLLMTTGGLVVTFGAVNLVTTLVSWGNSPDRILGHLSRGAISADEASDRWQRWAQRQRTARRWISGGATVAGAGALGVGTYFALESSAANPRDDGMGTAGALMLGAGTGLLLTGLWGWFVPTPGEQRLEQYRAAERLNVDVAVLPSGASVGVRGSF